MQQTWRWFGPDDLVTLAHVRQAGATGVVSALHHLNHGEAWPLDEVEKRRKHIEEGGLVWSVAESISVHDDIKTRTGQYRDRIELYKQSIRAIAACGIKTLCYNFMAITDWTRTDLAYPLPHGGTALRFDSIDFCTYDVFVLQRPNSEAAYSPSRILEARDRLKTVTPAHLERLENNLIAWVPAREFIYDRTSFRQALAAYANLGADGLRSNLIEFVKEITPVAEESGVKLAIHPDDPPFPLFGLPRVMSTTADVRALFNAVPSTNNGLTFCTGSFGVSANNNLLQMINEFGARINFIHLRNTTRDPDGSFTEADHLGGDTDMVAVIAALLREEKTRRATGRPDHEIAMRPDHGHAILDDIGKLVNPGYSAIGRLKGLAELRGVICALTHLNSYSVY